MEQLLSQARKELEHGRRAVLVTIASSEGSTPRGTGATMLVGESGILAGTIGGGELEYRCAQAALAPPEALMRFALNHQTAADLGMICGGSAQVLFTPLTDANLLRDAVAPGWILLPMDGSAPSFVWEGMPDRPVQVQWKGKQCISVPLAQTGRVFLLGGGHVALELSRLLDILEYPYLVVDDRREFSGEDRFPRAEQTLTVEFPDLKEALCGSLLPNKKDCICVMTRGHLSDTDALRFALSTEAGYIGVMGSRRKRERVFAQLAAEGFDDAAERIVTPIGLPIGGQTPAEIAVSIAAQLVQVRNQ